MSQSNKTLRLLIKKSAIYVNRKKVTHLREKFKIYSNFSNAQFIKIKPPTTKNRNVLVESARITRGNINSLEKLKAANFNALIIPGGFGAAKNL